MQLLESVKFFVFDDRLTRMTLTFQPLKRFFKSILFKVQKQAQTSSSSHLLTNITAKQYRIMETLGNMEELPISKSKLKKLKRDREWEENREQRKAKRKEKIKEKKERKRAAHGAGAPGGLSLSNPSENPTHSNNACKPSGKKYNHPIQLPITIVIDCGFDELMSEKECKSLGAQITRCYSDNQKAPFKANLVISSFGGRLKERFNNILSGHYSSWKGARFLEVDFYEAGEQAKEWMKGARGEKLSGALAHKDISDQPSSTEEQEAGELVYLTSDSPDTLTELKPYSTYIIGGIVDRNRHKGICYKRAMDRGVKTARLPIGDYMHMTSRFVLATNHVSEIMLRWLELGDWGEAFLRVIPKRKGGILKSGRMGGEGETGTGMEDQDGNDNDEVEQEMEEEHENLDGDNLKIFEVIAEKGEERVQSDLESKISGGKPDSEIFEGESIQLSLAKPDNNHQESAKGA